MHAHACHVTPQVRPTCRISCCGVCMWESLYYSIYLWFVNNPLSLETYMLFITMIRYETLLRHKDNRIALTDLLCAMFTRMLGHKYPNT